MSLPDGWVALVDPTHGVEYYFDTVNQASQWERPTKRSASHVFAEHGEATAAKFVDKLSTISAPLPAGWLERIDQTHGTPYYFDLVKQCSQWERPKAPAGTEEEVSNSMKRIEIGQTARGPASAAAATTAAAVEADVETDVQANTQTAPDAWTAAEAAHEAKVAEEEPVPVSEAAQDTETAAEVADVTADEASTVHGMSTDEVHDTCFDGHAPATHVAGSNKSAREPSLSTESQSDDPEEAALRESEAEARRRQEEDRARNEQEELDLALAISISIAEEEARQQQQQQQQQQQNADVQMKGDLIHADGEEITEARDARTNERTIGGATASSGQEYAAPGQHDFEATFHSAFEVDFDAHFLEPHSASRAISSPSLLPFSAGTHSDPTALDDHNIGADTQSDEHAVPSAPKRHEVPVADAAAERNVAVDDIVMARGREGMRSPSDAPDLPALEPVMFGLPDAPVSASTNLLPLPDGWVEQFDPSYAIPYYVHVSSQRSQWERPTSHPTDQPQISETSEAGMNVSPAVAETTPPVTAEVPTVVVEAPLTVSGEPSAAPDEAEAAPPPKHEPSPGMPQQTVVNPASAESFSEDGANLLLDPPGTPAPTPPSPRAQSPELLAPPSPPSVPAPLPPSAQELDGQPMSLDAAEAECANGRSQAEGMPIAVAGPGAAPFTNDSAEAVVPAAPSLVSTKPDKHVVFVEGNLLPPAVTRRPDLIIPPFKPRKTPDQPIENNVREQQRPPLNPPSACSSGQLDSSCTSKRTLATPTKDPRQIQPSDHEPPSRDLGVQVDDVGSAVQSLRDESRDDSVVNSLREQLSSVRRRCDQLETRLDGEGSVMLAAFKRHKTQLVAANNRNQQLSMHASALLSRLDSMRHHTTLKLAMQAWRHTASASVAMRTAMRAQREELLAELTTPNSPPSEGLSPLPQLPPFIDRREMYRYSYEALIDRVLDLQRAFHEYAEAATSKSAQTLATAS